MGYLLGFIWCIVFGGLGFFLISERKKHAAYKSFTGKVESIETIKGRNTAIVQSGIPEIGIFHIQFQDPGDYSEGSHVDCMWDGKNPKTAQEDLRDNQRYGVFICFLFVAAMIVILLFSSVFL